MLVADRSVPARAPRPVTGRKAKQGEPATFHGPGLAVFSRRTRRYLARRAFRYFRRLAHRDPARYRRAMAVALPLYRDEELQAPEQLLDAWSLCHVLFGSSPALERIPGGVALADGHTLKELAPAPLFEQAWRDGFDELLALVERARCRTVRSWALSLVKRLHLERLQGLPLSRIRAMLGSPVEEVQSLGAELLESAPGLDALPIGEWLELLRVQNPALLPSLCDLVRERVAPERLTLEQCVALACSPAAPVAQLGLAWAKQKPVQGAGALASLAPLAGARAPSVRAEAVAWFAELLRQSREAQPELVRDLIDARFADARARGLELMLGDERLRDQAQLWAALAESPYDDVRAVLVKHLEERARAFGPQTLRHLWASSLLAVHRGGAAKRRVVAQLAQRITAAPGEAAALLPLLAIALRSVRAPERRSALAALSQAAFREPKLRGAIAQAMPELKLFAEEAA